MNAATIVDPLHSKALPDLVRKLLAARQQSLVLYNKLAALKPFTLAEPVRHLLRQFRQSLIDYLALGPFEVYQALEEQPGDSPYCPARDLARQLYAPIASTTQVALVFTTATAARRPPRNWPDWRMSCRVWARIWRNALSWRTGSSPPCAARRRHSRKSAHWRRCQ